MSQDEAVEILEMGGAVAGKPSRAALDWTAQGDCPRMRISLAEALVTVQIQDSEGSAGRIWGRLE